MILVVTETHQGAPFARAEPDLTALFKGERRSGAVGSLRAGHSHARAADIDDSGAEAVRIVCVNKCDRDVADNRASRQQVETARVWSQRARAAFLECSASHGHNVAALASLVALYACQRSAEERRLPWLAPRWGRSSAGRWLAERRRVGAFVIYPWFWRRERAQHDSTCTHQAAAAFELAEIVANPAGGAADLFVQHKSVRVERLPSQRGEPLRLRFVLSGDRRGFPTLSTLVACQRTLALGAYNVQPLLHAPPDPNGEPQSEQCFCGWWLGFL